MTATDREQLLATSLDDFRLRQTRGERPTAEDYAAHLDDVAYDEFLEILDVEAAIDDLLVPPPEIRLPREFGPYVLRKVIGRGAAGIVYEAENVALGRREAVKVLQGGLEAEGTLLERFREEARVLAGIRHPHIVEVHGAGQEEGRPYYAMGLIDGVPLSTWIRSADRPTPEALCRGLAGVADALEALHEKGTLHRDVKPSNIVVDGDGRMVLADFGLARSLTSPRVTRTGQTPGTPLYMSPEQILGKTEEIDRRADVYALGATLYEALSGRPLFAHDDWRTIFRSALTERPEPLRRVAPGLPVACADIAMKAVERRKEDRYPTAAALRDDLLAFAAGEPVRGRPVSSLRHGWRRMRRFVLPAAAVLLVGLAIATWWGMRPGHLLVRSPVPFEVWVDGVQHALVPPDVPAEVPLARGAHLVELRHEAFAPYQQEIEIAPGQSLPLTVAVPLRVVRADDPEAVALLGRIAGLEPASLRPKSKNRYSQRRTYVAALPAGRVRLGDLDRYRLEMSVDELPAGTRLVFRRGSDVLHEEPFAPESILPDVKPIPAAVLFALRVGDEVTWGLEVPDGDDVLQTFEVVPADEAATAALDRIDEVLAHQTAALRAAVRAQALLQRGLAYAAWREVAEIVDRDHPTASGVAPWVQHQEALVILGLDGRTTLWRAGDEALWNHHFPRALVYRWYGEDVGGE